jgi:two-component system OmpR family sensor kinase
MRVKLITAVLTLVAIALLTISVAGLGFLRSYQIGQADSQLDALATSTGPGSVQQAVLYYVRYGRPSPDLTSSSVAIGWIPAGGGLHWVLQESRGFGPSAGAGTGSLSAVPLPAVSASASWLSTGAKATIGAQSGSSRYRVLAVSEGPFFSSDGATSGTVIIALDVSDVYKGLGRLAGIDIIISSVLLAGIAVLGVTVIRASLRPLSDIEKTAEAIAAGELSRRVPNQDPRTEVGRLGNSLNTMLTQIEAAFQARSASETAARKSEDKLRQFVADASHELRTPLTAIRGFAEYYRQRGGVATTGPAPIAAPPARPELPAGAGSRAGLSAEAGAEASASAGVLDRFEPAGSGHGKLAPAELDRIMRRVEQESSRMGILVEDMLLLARLDQQRPLEHQTVDLLTLAADAVHDARVVAPDRSIHLTVGAGAALLVLGDEVRLRQVIGNLMSNALNHTPDGSAIDVRIRSGSVDEARFPGNPDVARGRSAAVLEVADHGPGLSREQAERVFERFYRADQARTSGGSGLGLAIVASLVAAHGGAVWVQSVPGAGATFRIALPLAPEALDAGEDVDEEPDADAEADAGPSADAADFSELTS